MTAKGKTDVPEIYTASYALGRLTGEFLGHGMMAREICPYVEHHWPNQRIKGVATSLGESHGRLGAYNDNHDETGITVSRDCGPMQDNIVARYIDTLTEWSLRTLSSDPVEIDRVMKSNMLWAYQLWSTMSDFRDGKRDYRRWRPWVADTSGWAWHPRCYVWHRDIDKNPVGPWVKTGEYLQKAIRGVANYDHLTKKKSAKDVLAWVEVQCQNFGILPEWCQWDYDSKKLIYYIPEKLPVAPPEPGELDYAQPNDGR